MKKFLFSTAMLLMAVSAGFAQSAKVVSAFNYLKDGDLDQAKSSINEATNDPKTGVQPKTWYYRGLIYRAIYDNRSKISLGMTKADVIKILGDPKSINKTTTPTGDEELLVYENEQVNISTDGKVDYVKSGDSDPVKEAIMSFEKAISLDPKNQFKSDIQQELIDCANYAYNDGVAPYNRKDFQTSYDNFSLASNTYDYLNDAYKQGLVDTFATLYAGNAALKMKKYDDAMAMYQKLLDKNISRPELYASLGDLYIQKGDTAKAKEVIAKGTSLYPDDKGLMVQELNLYLFSGNPQEAIEKLKAAIAKDPDFTELYIQLGNLYDQIHDTTNSRIAYEQAIKKDPNSFNGYYRLGASYYNRAVDINNQMNKLDLNQQKQYDAFKVQRDALFKLALPYLERAYQLDSKDEDTLGALKELYARLGQMDKSNEMKKELDALKGQ